MDEIVLESHSETDDSRETQLIPSEDESVKTQSLPSDDEPQTPPHGHDEASPLMSPPTIQSPLMSHPTNEPPPPTMESLQMSPPTMNLPEYVSPAPFPTEYSQSPPLSEPASPSCAEPIDPPPRDVSGTRRSIAAEGLGGASTSAQPLTLTSRLTSKVAEELGGQYDPFHEEIKHTNPIWMAGYLPHMVGWQVDGIGTKLFDTSSLIGMGDSFVYQLEPSMRDKFYFNAHDCFIELFCRWKLFKRRELGGDRVHPDDRAIAWNAFVIQFRRDPVHWALRYQNVHDRFLTHSLLGMKMAVHEESRNCGRRCRVPSNMYCEFCYNGVAAPPFRV
ncbi:uncharacterized protein KRP23_11336 [Phytophthora ramorum]|uniref:uncharacterized protein n=1 Tax=Phytophthora ramorum TaxID=164328 RepID=UPI0030A161D0|nr:hypothetical protein KRP23_11336 [Phytophthora ramorum]